MFAPYEASAWDKVFKNGPSKICGRLSLENLKGYEAGCIPSNFLKAVFHKFYLVHYWMRFLNDAIIENKENQVRQIIGT